MKTFKETLNLINAEIQNINWSITPKGLYEPIGYILSLGGKRIRPTLALMSSDLYTEDTTAIMKAAIGLEVFHNFTLLHDDIMDRADVRRGQPTVHKKWCDNTAILSGDVMQIEAYKWMCKVPENKLKQTLDIFSKMAAEICEGQQYDMEFESRESVALAEYLNMIRLKTAVLLASACELGGVMGNASVDDTTALYEFGESLGMAFQLKDDLLDTYGDERTFGKKIGGDILCGKKTYLLINALDRADVEKKKELLAWLQVTDASKNAAKIEAIKTIYNKLGVKGICEQEIDGYVKNAKVSLSKVLVAESKKTELYTLVDSLTKRVE